MVAISQLVSAIQLNQSNMQKHERNVIGKFIIHLNEIKDNQDERFKATDFVKLI